jgi:hypothetical protein
MSIIASELVWRRSSVITDDGTNGDVMSAVVSPSGVKNNVWPDVPQAERTSGSLKYRKMFIHVANDDDLSLVAPRVFVETRTPGEDAITLFAATQSDVKSGITGSEDLFGMAVLTNPVSAGASAIVVTVEDDYLSAPLDMFRVGELIRLSNKANVDAGGFEEYHVLTIVSAPSGNDVTLTLTGVTLNDYIAGDKVSSVYEPSDVVGTVPAFSNLGSGTFDVTGVVPDSIGTIQMDWTLTFDTATDYTVRDDQSVIVGTGIVGSDASPNNPDYTKPYFTLLAANFSGTFVAAETITFTTAPASLPIWYRRDIPAGAASLSGNSVVVAVDGESS